MAYHKTNPSETPQDISPELFGKNPEGGRVMSTEEHTVKDIGIDNDILRERTLDEEIGSQEYLAANGNAVIGKSDLGQNPEGQRFGRADYSQAAANANDTMSGFQYPNTPIAQRDNFDKIPGVSNWKEGDVAEDPSYERNDYIWGNYVGNRGKIK